MKPLTEKCWVNPGATLVVLAFFLPANAPAANRIWDGGGANDSWTNGANWNGRLLAPDPGDDLSFPAGAARLSNNNNFAAGTDFNLITFSGAGYSIAGNQVGLTAGLNVTHGAGNTNLHLPLGLNANQAFTVSQAGASLFLFGTVGLGFRTLTIDGAGNTVVVGNISDTLSVGRITKTGTGTLYILSNPSYGGTTTVNGGIVRVDGAVTNSRVIVNAGGTLRGVGTVAGITANSGGTVSPGFNTTNALNSSGDLLLNAGSTLNIRLNGLSAELNYDQIDVTGTVTLGGTLNVTTGFAVPVGTTFTIIDNDGSDDITGTFAGLPEGAEFMINGRPFRISYGAPRIGGIGGRDNDVTLEAIPALSVWDGGGGPDDAWSAALNWAGDLVPQPGDDLQFGVVDGLFFPRNDFPAGRVTGSIIFAGGSVDLEGNAIVINGQVRTAAPGSFSVSLPITLRNGVRVTHDASLSLVQSVTLSGNQAFLLTHPDGLFRGFGALDMVTHDLTLDFVPLTAQTGMHPDPGLMGPVSGQGKVTKLGAGLAIMGDAAATVAIQVDEGLLCAGELSGPALVNAGGTLRAEALGDVDIAGGRLQTGEGTTTVTGALRFVPTGVLEITLLAGHFQSYLSGNSIDVSGATLDLNVDENLPPNSVAHNLVTPTSFGVFNGLPEGSRFVSDGHVISLSYMDMTTGARIISVILDPPYYWDGAGGNSLWTNAANWNPNYLPVEGSVLVFPDGVSNRIMNNDFPPGTVFGRLIFQRSSYIVGGNPFALTNGIGTADNSGVTSLVAGINLPSSDSFLDLQPGSELRMSGAVTGRFKKEGGGKLVFSGTNPNNITSARLLGGDVELDKSSAVALGGGIDVGVSVQGGGSATGVLRLLQDHQIADDAEVNVLPGSTFDLNNQVDLIGSLEGSGDVILGGGFVSRGRLTIQSGSFNGTISGRGTFAKDGPGAFVWLGTSTFTGSAIVQDGELRLDGTLSSSNLVVNGGLLRGRGTAPAIIANAGIVAPGTDNAGSNVKLNSGDITMAASATFSAFLTGLTPGFDTQPLNVTGTVNLGACRLDLEKKGNHIYPPGQTFNIINNDGGDLITGTFAGLPQNANFTRVGFRWQISYAGGDGNDVAITVIESLPPDISAFAVQPGTGANAGMDVVDIDGQGIAGVQYDLEGSTDLINWTVRQSQYASNSTGALAFGYSAPAVARTYFRVRQR